MGTRTSKVKYQPIPSSQQPPISGHFRHIYTESLFFTQKPLRICELCNGNNSIISWKNDLEERHSICMNCIYNVIK